MSIADDNKAECFKAIHRHFANAQVSTLTWDRHSGHYILKGGDFWTFEFEVPSRKGGFWCASLSFHPADALVSKKYTAWHLEADSMEKLVAKIREHMDSLVLDTAGMWRTRGSAPEAPPKKEDPEDPAIAKVVNALRKKPPVLWGVLQALAKERVAGPWEEQELEGSLFHARCYIDPLSEDGKGVAASVSEDGSRWNTRWMEGDALSASVKHPSKEAAFEFTDKMLRNRGWILL